MSFERYTSIFGRPHHESKKYPRMSRVNRAAQFSPFAALVGYDEMIDETDRHTDDWIDFGEDKTSVLDRKLQLIVANQDKKPLVEVTYFAEDERKAGGKYLTVKKNVKRVDLTLRRIEFTDKTNLPLSCVTDFSGEDIDIDPL